MTWQRRMFQELEGEHEDLLDTLARQASNSSNILPFTYDIYGIRMVRRMDSL
jgi:hypothetical protein